MWRLSIIWLKMVHVKLGYLPMYFHNLKKNHNAGQGRAESLIRASNIHQVWVSSAKTRYQLDYPIRSQGTLNTIRLHQANIH
jgi:hypothetical protein